VPALAEPAAARAEAPARAKTTSRRGPATLRCPLPVLCVPCRRAAADRSRFRGWRIKSRTARRSGWERERLAGRGRSEPKTGGRLARTKGRTVAGGCGWAARRGCLPCQPLGKRPIDRGQFKCAARCCGVGWCGRRVACWAASAMATGRCVTVPLLFLPWLRLAWPVRGRVRDSALCAAGKPGPTRPTGRSGGQQSRT